MGIGCKPCNGAQGAVYSWSHAYVAVSHLMPALLHREAACATWQVLVVLSAAVAYASWDWLHAQLARVQNQDTAPLQHPLLAMAMALGLCCWLLACIRRASRWGMAVPYLRSKPHWVTRDSCGTAAASDASPSCPYDQNPGQQPPAPCKAPGPALSSEQTRAVTCSVQQLLQAVAGGWDTRAVHQQLQLLAQLVSLEEAGRLVMRQGAAGCVVDAMVRAASVAASTRLVSAEAGDEATISPQDPDQHVVLQGSWVLLQLAGSTPEVAQQLQEAHVLQQLRHTLELLCPPPASSPALSAAVRNIIWTCYLLTQQDAANNSSSSSSSSAMWPQQQQLGEAAGSHANGPLPPPAAAEATTEHAPCHQQSAGTAAALLHECGMLAVLHHEALALRWGPLPAVLAVATLGNCLAPTHPVVNNLARTSRGSSSGSSVGHVGLSADDVHSTTNSSSSTSTSRSVHGSSDSVSSAAGRAAADALCGKDGGRAILLAWLQQGLEPWLFSSLHRALLVLTRSRPQHLLRSLIEQQLLGSFLQAAPQDISSRMVCQLLSSTGQQMLVDVEAAYQLDVAVALAQVIPLPCHTVVPALHSDQWLAVGQEASSQGTAAGPSSRRRRDTGTHRQLARSSSSSSSKGVSTQLLACRLLLQHQRLPELLLGYAADLLQRAETGGAAGILAGQPTGTLQDPTAASAPAPAPALVGASTMGAAEPVQMLPGAMSAPPGVVPDTSNGQGVFGRGSVRDCGMCQRVDCPRRAAAVAAAAAAAGAGVQGAMHAISNPSSPLPNCGLLAPIGITPVADAAAKGAGEGLQASGSRLVEPGPATAVEQLLVHLACQPLQLQGAVVMQGSGFPASSGSTQHSQSTAGSTSGPHGLSLARVSLSAAADGASWLYTAAEGAPVKAMAAAPGVELGPGCTAPAMGLRADRSDLEQRTLSGRRWSRSGSSSSSSSSNSGRWCTFVIGDEQQVRVSISQVRLLRQASPLLHFLLKDATASSAQQPISFIAVPGFSTDVNAWVLRHLLEWVEGQQLQPNLVPEQLSHLWVAADFLQVDGLRAACENRLDAGLPQGPAWVEAALQLCDQHHHASARLQTLVLRVLMAGVGDWLAREQLRAFVVQYTALLVPGMVRELRDVLAAKCLLTFDLDDD